MNRVRLARADHRYLLFAELYTRLEEPKSKRKAFALLEAAILCYSKKGFDFVTMEMIAREAGVTRTLLKHYFDGPDQIREMSVQYIRLLFQKMVLAAIDPEAPADRMLTQYVQACFAWVANLRVHSLVWLAFLHRCASHPKLRELNTLAASVGEDRISNLILKGQAEKIFAAMNAPMAAKQIQCLITGALVMAASENLEDRSAFEAGVCRLCLLAAGAAVS